MSRGLSPVPMHQPRPAGRPAKQPATAAQATPARQYPPGYFTQPVLDWFGPCWESRWPQADTAAHLAALAMAQREHAVATGTGWGAGTMVMPNTPHQRRPGWL